jgi:hypothetical protein
MERKLDKIILWMDTYYLSPSSCILWAQSQVKTMTYQYENNITIIIQWLQRHAVAYLVEALRYRPKGCGFDPQWGHRICSIDLILPAALGPGVNSTSNINEYQESSLGWGKSKAWARKDMGVSSRGLQDVLSWHILHQNVEKNENIESR